MFNIRKLIQDFHQKISEEFETPTESPADTSMDGFKEPSRTLAKRAAQARRRISGIVETVNFDTEAVKTRDTRATTVRQPNNRVTLDLIENTREFCLLKVAASAFMSWGVDPEIDKICEEKLGLRRLPSNVTLSIRGYLLFLIYLFIILRIFLYGSSNN